MFLVNNQMRTVFRGMSRVEFQRWLDVFAFVCSDYQHQKKMGSQNAKEAQKAEIRARNKREIESMYQMIDETICIYRSSKMSLSDSNLSLSKVTKINNLDEVIEQLMESFKTQEKYLWGMGIYKQFKKHFTRCFEEEWSVNKENFYQIILDHCKFQTIDFQKELKEIGANKQLALPDRNSFKDFFYQVGATKLENRLPSSIISQDSSLEPDFLKQIQEEQGQDQFNLNAINATIINNEFNPNLYMQSQYENTELNDSDFLPLFLKTNEKEKLVFQEVPSPKKNKVYQEENKLKEQIREARIQNSSLVMPQTIFLNRLSQAVKQEIGDLVSFYREFGNALQRMLFSVSVFSAPFKHFIFLLTEEMRRKNITNRKKTKSTYPTTSSNLSPMQKLLYGENGESYQFRERRSYNNDMILLEIKDFTEAYTEFIWKYLELYDITQIKLGKLISIEALYGIVLKSVWRHVEFISDRGYEYEQWKLQQYYQYMDSSKNCKLTEDKKKYLLRILKKIKNEKNPQKYLKKIVILYRQTSSCVTCADQLLYIYEELLIQLIKAKQTKSLGLFRMRNVIEKLLKIDDTYSGGGEIGYSWTSWCIITELLRNKVTKEREDKGGQRMSKIITEPDAELYFQEEQNVNL